MIEIYTDTTTIAFMYNSGLSYRKISKILSISQHQIGRTIKSLDIIPRKQLPYNIDETFFDTIDAEDKAYFLGYLYADGSIEKNTTKIRMSLNEKDKMILEKFAISLKTNNPLKFRTSKGRNQYELKFNNKHLYNTLFSHGCLPMKSLTLELPTKDYVKEQYFHHFIRGYFDGDGCIHIGKRNNGKVSICASFQFSNGFIQIINPLLNCNFRIYKQKDNKIHKICLGGNKQIRRFRDWLYKDATIFLDRKKKIFDTMHAPNKH